MYAVQVNKTAQADLRVTLIEQAAHLLDRPGAGDTASDRRRGGHLNHGRLHTLRRHARLVAGS